jgi:non-heme chloroperoxidase
VPIADSALLSVKLLKNGVLKVYEKLPHGMCTTHADVVNPALLAFIKSGGSERANAELADAAHAA